MNGVVWRILINEQLSLIKMSAQMSAKRMWAGLTEDVASEFGLNKVALLYIMLIHVYNAYRQSA